MYFPLELTEMAQKRARTDSAGGAGGGDGAAAGDGAPLFDEAAFDALAAEMAAEDATRDAIIKRSRDVLKLSKTSIYALHRGDVARAVKQLDQARKIAKEELLPMAEGGPAFLRGGMLSSALEEYAEARVFEHFLKTGGIPAITDLEICSRDEYLGGVLDFSGELNRYAVLRATDRDVEAVRKCRELTDRLMAAFMKFDFRNGPLRKKYDALKCVARSLDGCATRGDSRSLTPAGTLSRRWKRLSTRCLSALRWVASYRSPQLAKPTPRWTLLERAIADAVMHISNRMRPGIV